VIRLCALCALITPLVVGVAIASADPKVRTPSARTVALCAGRLAVAFPDVPYRLWTVLSCSTDTVVAREKRGTYMVDKSGEVFKVEIVK
jgi:hypothetical protein